MLNFDCKLLSRAFGVQLNWLSLQSKYLKAKSIVLRRAADGGPTEGPSGGTLAS
jgi:hypothetical protein